MLFTFSVIEVDRLLGDNQIEELNCHIKYNECLIEIDKSMDQQVKEMTLLHELMHGLTAFHSIKISEAEVERLTYGLASMLPEIMTWWGK